MKQHIVISSLITHIGYADHVLRIWFKDGSIWDYAGVQPDVFREMIEVESPGKYFHQNVKGKYKASKYTPTK